MGGKGQDVGVAMSCLLATEEQTRTDKVLLAQFLGEGPEGDAVSNTLSTKHGLSDALTIRNAAPLRTCTTIVGADEATELVETSGEVTGDEMKALQNKVDELTKAGGKANCVCIMGEQILNGCLFSCACIFYHSHTEMNYFRFHAPWLCGRYLCRVNNSFGR